MRDNKHIQSFNEHQENLNISDVRSSFINEDKSQLEADVELKLINFFESFSKYHSSNPGNYEIDRQWVIDRFNDKETEKFINYVCDVLVRKTK
jgi:hypothetical protein